jgi:hypothetical protein
MEPQKYALKMQQEMITEIRAARPKYCVFVNVPVSWLPRRESNKLILDWSLQYLSEHYDIVGLADTLSEEHTDYYWGREAAAHSPWTECYIYVLKRKI